MIQNRISRSAKIAKTETKNKVNRNTNIDQELLKLATDIKLFKLNFI